MGVSEEKLNKFYMYLEKIGIKLFPYQKILIKETLERSNAYVIYPPNIGKTDFRMLEKMASTVYGDEKNIQKL